MTLEQALAKIAEMEQQAEKSAPKAGKLVGKLVFVSNQSYYGYICRLVSDDGKKARVSVVCGPAIYVGKEFPTDSDKIVACSDHIAEKELAKLVEHFAAIWKK